MPHLHFLLEKGESCIEAVNLEFGLVATGKTETEATSFLAEMLIEYIKKTVMEFGYKTLVENAKNDALSDLWSVYRGLEFSFAETKNDLSYAFDRDIEAKIKKELMKRYDFKTKLNYQVKKDAA